MRLRIGQLLKGLTGALVITVCEQFAHRFQGGRARAARVGQLRLWLDLEDDRGCGGGERVEGCGCGYAHAGGVHVGWADAEWGDGGSGEGGERGCGVGDEGGHGGGSGGVGEWGGVGEGVGGEVGGVCVLNECLGWRSGREGEERDMKMEKFEVQVASSFSALC